MESEQNTPEIKRQAIVIIHGIGEQQPMETLRGFVDALLKEDNQNKEKGRRYHSKPDTISNSYELRRIKLRKFEEINKDWSYETDFYEYYWAHRMSGTRWPHVLNWIGRILLRSREDLKNSLHHERLKKLFKITWSFLVVAALLVLVTFLTSIKFGLVPALASGGAMAVALYLVYWFLRGFVLEKAKDVIGDAARYLDIRPVNVSCRYDILRGGIDMLRNLHEQPSKYTEDGKVRYPYDRIVVIGHSLGSIIAYDLLKHYWAEVNGLLQIKHGEALAETENFDHPKCSADTGRDQFLRAQYNLWRELNKEWLGKDEFECHKAPPARWLVTDFITLGSPLSYGALLLADSADKFKERTELRELPICPPDRSRHVRPGHFEVPLDQEADVSTAFKYNILHHGALFAVTRWTNLYFPNDLIAGQLWNVFGKGIHDIPLTEGPKFGLRAHTSYWAPKSTRCLDVLKSILTDIRWSEHMV
jgi:hypothetical protein